MSCWRLSSLGGGHSVRNWSNSCLMYSGSVLTRLTDKRSCSESKPVLSIHQSSACVCVCVCACVHACVCVCVCACVHACHVEYKLRNQLDWSQRNLDRTLLAFSRIGWKMTSRYYLLCIAINLGILCHVQGRNHWSR